MRSSFAFRLSSISLAISGLLFSSLAGAQSLEDRIRALEAQIGQMESTSGEGGGSPVEIYGSLRTQLTYESTEADNAADDSTTDFVDAFSRIGIRTSTNMGDFKASARGEWKVDTGGNANFGDGRLAYITLEHKDLGTIGFGQQWGGYYNMVGALVDVANFGSPGAYNNLSGGTFRIGNALTYTKNIAGVGIQVDLQADGSAGERDNLDAYGLAASYTIEGATIGIAHREVKDDRGANNDTLTGLAVGYKIGPAYLALSYNQQDDGTNKPSGIDLAATYSFGKNKLIGQYYTWDTDTTDGDRDGIILSAQHQMNSQFRVWTALRLTDNDLNNAETTSLDLGMRYDFSLKL